MSAGCALRWLTAVAIVLGLLLAAGAVLAACGVTFLPAP
jgi:hypothetical protein